MTERAQQGAHQRRLAGAEIAIEVDNQPWMQHQRQFGPKTLGRAFVRQIKFSVNISSMQGKLSPPDTSKLAALIKQWGQELGFSAIGIARAEIGEAAPRLRDWLERGYQGEMDYMARHADLRSDPQSLVAGTVTVISAALDYLPHAPDPDRLKNGGQAIISCYAQGRDYHKVMRQRLQQLTEKISALVGEFGYRVFSDSAPVMEVEFARQAGLGWRGKHSLLLARQGSWRFLGEIYTDLSLPSDAPLTEHCGRCTACLDACPTGAIVAPYQVDARRCISYLTIELAGSIPEELRPLIGNRIYGCDDCQLCCPWNRFARLGDPEFAARHALDRSSLIDLFAWTEAEFNSRLAGNPIRRIGHERWLRNIAVALGNAPRQPEILLALQARSDHPSPLVREHVVWAMAKQQRH